MLYSKRHGRRDISKLPVRQLTSPVHSLPNRGFSKLPVRQLTARFARLNGQKYF